MCDGKVKIGKMLEHESNRKKKFKEKQGRRLEKWNATQ